MGAESVVMLQARFSKIVGFGDSMLDSGNIVESINKVHPEFGPVMPRYYKSNMTNGPVILEHLADLFGVDQPTPSVLGGFNFAYGGAQTILSANLRPVMAQRYNVPAGLFIPSALRQVEEYIEGGLDPEALHLISTGGNDFLASILDQEPPPVGIFAEEIPRIAQMLIDAGATKIVVLRVASGPLMIPRFQKLPPEHSHPLHRMMHDLTGLLLPLTEVPEVLVYDMTWLMQAIHDDPVSLGFANIKDPYTESDGTSEMDGYVFWDDVHLTTRIHRLIAEDIHRMLSGRDSSFRT